MPSRGVKDKFSRWLEERDGKCLVAGPCSVESEEQVIHTAMALAQHEVTLLRGGIWKPRTRPGSFEGMGAKALPWLKSAGEISGLPVATEVATPAHVEACLKAGIDVLWIGARTTTNPIMVQEIAESLSGVDVPVLVKNPMNPDLQLWIGAIERLTNAGVPRLVAVHRGFSTHMRRKYRNQPLWDIPSEFRQNFPELPMLCDPSHISGKRCYIAAIAQDAMDMCFDGLMVESHWSPQTALTDAQQQLTPVQYGRLIRELLRNTSVCQALPDQELRNLLREVEEIESDLGVLLSKRQRVSRALEQYRNRQNSLTRTWTRICANRCKDGGDAGEPGESGESHCEDCLNEEVERQNLAAG